MVFSSIPFLFFFLPLFILCYQLMPAKREWIAWKNMVLLAFSLFFYAWGEPIYIILMIIVTFSDYLVGRAMMKAGPTKKKFLLGWSLFFDLSILCFFKYANFLIDTWNRLTGGKVSALHISLPLGISFFTFQTLSYVIDLYRGEIEGEKNYFTYLTYVSMFPQLVAGPIVRYQTVRKELTDRSVDMNLWQEGFLRFLRGLFKKVLLANQIGRYWESVSGAALSESSIVSIWLAAISFTFQIYYDFSGYSDMAIGMGRMMGFHFDENFDHPLSANSITDFWRKWHISLSSWFRNYVYIPLGGNRVKRAKHIRNILVVWLLTGLWHGASWNFVLWGLYYAVWLLLEKMFYGKSMEKWPAFCRHFYTWVIVVSGFVIFALESFGRLGAYLKAMVGIGVGAFSLDKLILEMRSYGVIFLICFLLCWPKITRLSFARKLRPVFYLGLLTITIACLVSDSYNPFLYFRF